MSANSGLLAFIDQLRGKGVRTFKGPFEGDVIEVELGQPLLPDAPPEPAGKDETVCACKCPVYAHTNGLCLAGCGPEKCAPGAVA